MAGWREEPLGAVCQFINRGISPAYLEHGGVAVLNQKCVRDHAVNFDLGRRHDVGAKKVTLDRFVHAGDVLVNSTGTGTLGRVAQLREEPPEPTTVDSHVTIVRPANGLFRPEFFGYALVAIEEQIQQGGEGCGGQTELSRSKLAETYRIRYPVDLKAQERIVAILDEAFEGIATAKANAEKNLQNARELFARQLQALFSEPRSSWVASTLGATYDVRDGTHDSPKYHDRGWPLITSKNLRPEGLSFDDVKLIADADYRKINERSAVHKGDVLFAMIGTIGNPTVVEVEPDFAIKNVALFKIPKGQSGHFLRYYLSSQSVVSKMQSEARGTTQKFVGLGYLRAFPVTVPPQAEQGELVRELDDLAAETGRLEGIYEQKLAALDELMKSLLHRAFTGALTENSIDKQVAEVA